MTNPHPNVPTYLAAITAFNANDLATVSDHVRPEVVYRMPGRSIVVASTVAEGQVFVSDPDQVDDFWAGQP